MDANPRKKVILNMFERYQLAVVDRPNPHPHTVGRLVHWALAAQISGGIEFEALEQTLTPYLDRELILNDLTGHIGSEPITFSPAAITLDIEYGSQGLRYRRLFLPGFPSPYRSDSFRQFTFRLDPQNNKPTFEVYAETSF